MIRMAPAGRKNETLRLTAELKKARAPVRNSERMARF
jgi:hypothetical protein